MARLKRSDSLLARVSPVERAVRNALPKEALNATNAAKRFGVNVFKFNAALISQTSIIYRSENSSHILVNKKWKDQGYMAVENSQPFYLPNVLQYINGAVKRGELKF